MCARCGHPYPSREVRLFVVWCPLYLAERVTAGFLLHCLRVSLWEQPSNGPPDGRTSPGARSWCELGPVCGYRLGSCEWTFVQEVGWRQRPLDLMPAAGRPWHSPSRRVPLGSWAARRGLCLWEEDTRPCFPLTLPSDLPVLAVLVTPASCFLGESPPHPALRVDLRQAEGGAWLLGHSTVALLRPPRLLWFLCPFHIALLEFLTFCLFHCFLFLPFKNSSLLLRTSEASFLLLSVPTNVLLEGIEGRAHSSVFACSL